MIQEQTIRDFYGRILGFIETDDKGNKVARDFYRRIVGRYDKNRDVTTDFYGRVLTKGDTVASLIYNSK